MIVWKELTPQPQAGATFVMNLSVVDENGAAVDTTGWEFEFWLLKLSDGSAIDVSANLSVVAAATGAMRLTILRATTKTYGGIRFTGEFWRVDSENDAVLAKGPINFAAVAR